MIEDMTIRNLSQAAQQCYVRKFSRHFGKSPDRLGIEDVRAYQLHLIAQKRSWSHMNQTACALWFFYGVALGRQEALERIVNGREPEKLTRSDAGGDRALLGGGCGIAEPGRADNALRGRAPHRRGLPSEGGLD
jgi:Phage integrase, N-terminal SAM-like domain